LSYFKIIRHFKSLDCVPKSDAKIEITITTTNLTELNILLAALIIAFLALTLQISRKSTAQLLSNSRLKNGTQKQKSPIWKSRLISSYTITSITDCVQSGHRLHGHVRIVEHATVELLVFWSKQRHSIRRCFKWSTSRIR